ncbi:MAG: MFS transporter [Gammaproteobacteria bacterium]|nr:MFS transporter [Gammaproteobacteria bacterium]
MKNRYHLVLAVAGAGMFLAALDTGVINVALPFLRHDFHSTISKIAWTISGYFLVLSAAIVLFGKLGDRFGRLKIFSIGLLIFAIGSLLCGLSQSANQLIGWRIVQALGAAALQGCSAAIITTLVAEELRGQALGMFMLIATMGPIIGPTFAGTVIALFSWRWIFFINIPISLIILLGVRFLHDSSEYQKNQLDFIGMITFAIAIFLFVFALNLIGQPDRRTAIILIMMGLAIIFLLYFIYQEHRATSPMLDLQLFKNFSFNASVISTLALGFSTSTIFMIPPLELHLVSHLSAIHIGLILLSTPLGVGALSRFGGTIIRRWGEARAMLGGILTVLIALLLLIIRNSSWGVLSFPPLLLFYGIGVGLFMPANISHIMKAGKSTHQGTLGAINRMVLNVGNAIGVATAAMIIDIHIGGTFSSAPVLVKAFRQVWIIAWLALAASFLLLLLERYRQR